MYHGRKVLIALFSAGFMVYGGGLYGFVLLVPPLTEEFHWDRAMTTGLVTAFWLSAPLILLGGAAIKRFGATRLLIGGILIEASCVTLLSKVSTFPEMYALRALMGLGKVMFAVTLPYAVSRWYSRHHSLGLGIVWSGWHVGGMVLAPITGEILLRYGWRTACIALAVGLVTVGLWPIIAIRGPQSPREFGLGLDGEPLRASEVHANTAVMHADASAAGGSPPSGSLRQMLGTLRFWLIALGTLFFFMTYGGLLTHQPSIVEAAGFTPRLSSIVLGSTAGFAALGGICTGWIIDRYSLRLVGVAIHVLLIIGALSLLWVNAMHSQAALVSYAVCFGITIGGGDLYFVALMRKLFPTVSVAYSYSAWYFCQIFTLLLSGPAAGHVYDLTGNYDWTLELLAASAMAALVLSLPVLRTRRQVHENATGGARSRV